VIDPGIDGAPFGVASLGLGRRADVIEGRFLARPEGREVLLGDFESGAIGAPGQSGRVFELERVVLPGAHVTDVVSPGRLAEDEVATAWAWEPWHSEAQEECRLTTNFSGRFNGRSRD
jgi:hypothetical protein